MTISPASLSSLQSAVGQSSSTATSGVASTSTATAAGGTDFASSLDAATGGSAPNNLFAATLAQDAGQSATTTSAGGLASASGSASSSDLLSLLLGSSTGGAATGAAGASGTTTSGPTGSSVVAEAERFVGTPYVWGGSTPSGFDCSGLVQYVYGQLGVSLPRTSEEQAQAGTAVASLAQAQPGDLLFFAGSDGTAASPGHVGIYLGNGQMIDAPHTGTSVQVQQVPTDQVVAIRDVLPTGGSAGSGTVTMGQVQVPSAYAATIEQDADANGIPPALLAALLQRESNFDPTAVSSAGAQGIAQLMPSTAAGMGVNPTDPTQAIGAAAELLGSYTARFGNYADALAAYNAGPGAVEEYGGVPPYAETQAYVPAILEAAGLSGTGGTGS